MRLSIRFQLLLPLFALFLGVVGMSVWTALSSAERVRRQIDAQFAEIIATVQQSNFPLTDKVLHLMKGFSGADFYFFKGQFHWTTLATTEISMPVPPSIGATGALSGGQSMRVGDKGYLCTSVQLDEGPNAGGNLTIFYPESLWYDALWEAVRPSLILGAFGGLASFVLTVGLGQRLGRRIFELERRTRLIAAGDFSPMALPRRNDEIRDLYASINEMGQQLAQLQDAMRKTDQMRLLGQVSGGLAHQMRNGVAGARLAVQLHARESGGQGAAEPLQVALRQLALVEMHLKQFLSLGRNGESRCEPCDLRVVLGESVSLVTPQCRHVGIEMTWQPPAGPVNVLGDAGQLSQLLLNVLTNAMEAAGPSGSVDVRLVLGDAGQAIVEIVDSGPGPDPQVAPRLFEPFVTGKADGVGLGLAVASRVIAAHRGTINWSRAAERTCFRITLPLEPLP
jgi:signal transduction histidine kinase